VAILEPLSLVGGEPLSRMASRGSRAKPLSHAGDGAVEATLVMAVTPGVTVAATVHLQ
jgi:hypothetical protein